jgi:hypothetical protein
MKIEGWEHQLQPPAMGSCGRSQYAGVLGLVYGKCATHHTLTAQV